MPVASETMHRFGPKGRNGLQRARQWQTLKVDCHFFNTSYGNPQPARHPWSPQVDDQFHLLAGEQRYAAPIPSPGALAAGFATGGKG